MLFVLNFHGKRLFLLHELRTIARSLKYNYSNAQCIAGTESASGSAVWGAATARPFAALTGACARQPPTPCLTGRDSVPACISRVFVAFSEMIGISTIRDVIAV